VLHVARVATRRCSQCSHVDDDWSTTTNLEFTLHRNYVTGSDARIVCHGSLQLRSSGIKIVGLTHNQTSLDDNPTNILLHSRIQSCFTLRAQLIDGWRTGACAGEINNVTSGCVRKARTAAIIAVRTNSGSQIAVSKYAKRLKQLKQ